MLPVQSDIKENVLPTKTPNMKNQKPLFDVFSESNKSS